MNKHSIDSNRLRKLTLDQNANRIKAYLKTVVVNANQVTTEIIRLQAMIKVIEQARYNHDVLDTVKDISINAKSRLKSVNRQLAILKNCDSQIDVIMKKFKGGKLGKRIQSTGIATDIKRLRSLIKQANAQIRSERLHNQLASAKINQIRWFMTIPQHDLSWIKIFYVDPHNQVIKRQTELGRVCKSFSLITHLTGLPHHYHFVKVIVGQRLMIYRHNTQRTVVEIAKNPVSPELKADQNPQVMLDAQRPCRIRLIYLDSNGKIIRVHDSIGAKGTPFRLHRAMQLPDGYDLVRVISGLNVKRYQRQIQLIEIKIKSRNHQINASQVQQAFLDYYNARIMNVLPRSSNPSSRFGYHCAQQYLKGISDAQHGIAPQKNNQMYQHGYQIYRYASAKQPMKDNSFVDVLLKIYDVVIQDVALLNHDLRRGSVDF